MKRSHRESLSRYDEHAKWRHRFNRAKKQHAVDQMVFGSTLLRPPRDRAEADFYKCNNVFCTSTGEYFTTLKPVPSPLQSYVIGVKPIQLPARRCHYLFQLRHYESPEHALVGATMFAAWTMANRDYLGMRATDVFIEVTAAVRETYTEFVSSLYDTVRAHGRITPTTPPQLQVLIDGGLNIAELLRRHPPSPAPPFEET